LHLKQQTEEEYEFKVRLRPLFNTTHPLEKMVAKLNMGDRGFDHDVGQASQLAALACDVPIKV
jgi:hypothetical protein